MKTGKISDTVLNRTVLKNISRVKNPALITRPKAGSDAAVIRIGSQEIIEASDCGIEPVINVVNNISAKGGKAVAVQCCIIIPESYREIRLKEIMKKISADCAMLNVELTGGHTQVSRYVEKPVVCITGTGLAAEKYRGMNEKGAVKYKAHAGQDIIMTKWIGIGGIQHLIPEKREELINRFGIDFIDAAFGNRTDMSIVKEAEIANASGVEYMHDVSQGGIFAALSDLSENAGTGFDIDFRKITVKQEIIEICELYDINPYGFESSGCLLMTSDCGYDIVNILDKQGIKADIIGHMTDNNDKIIRNQDEVRYLDTPAQDELYRMEG